MFTSRCTFWLYRYSRRLPTVLYRWPCAWVMRGEVSVIDVSNNLVQCPCSFLGLTLVLALALQSTLCLCAVEEHSTHRRLLLYYYHSVPILTLLILLFLTCSFCQLFVGFIWFPFYTAQS